MTKQLWFEKVGELISEDIPSFYQHFYGITVGKTGKYFTMEPCPMCGHSDCCRATTTTITCYSASCGWNDRHISGYVEYASKVLKKTTAQAYTDISKFFKVPLPVQDGDKEEFKKSTKIQEIRKISENFYHLNLMRSTETFIFKGRDYTPLEYLKNVRGREESTITDFKIGFSGNFKELKQDLIERGYTLAEIKEADVSFYNNLFLFFYKHPHTNEIVMMNAKNPFGMREEFTGANGETEKGDVIKGYRKWNTSLLYTPGFSFKKPFVLVEGEHDLFSVYEHGGVNAACYGGNIREEALSIFDNAASIIYTCFDNDKAGETYLKKLNLLFPEKDIRKIQFPADYGDIDEYYIQEDKPLNIPDLMKDALVVEVENYKIRSVSKNVWTVEDRRQKLEFELKSISPKTNSPTGKINLYQGGQIVDRVENGSLSQCKASMKPFSYYLADHIDAHFNSGLEHKSWEELLEAYKFSSKKASIIGSLAKILNGEGIDPAELIPKFKKFLKGDPEMDKIVDLTLIELNNLKNSNVDTKCVRPRIKVAQYFNIPNRHAYYYFTFMKDDGDATRAIPYLMRNDKTLIRLDLLRRKDEQCLLMIDNLYELPAEVPVAAFAPKNCSLQDFWVQEYIDGNVPEEDLNPRKLIEEIEKWCRRFFITSDDNIYKILSLWCYGTYFYTMFGQYPYLYINGEKGSGKTSLNRIIEMFAFNAVSIVDTTEAALFRMAAINGGTLLLDEQEDMQTRTSSVKNGYGSILKSGYISGGNVIRVNTETGNIDSFDPYCPKTISNIFGLEDVISDRCLPIHTYQVMGDKKFSIEDPKYYIEQDNKGYKEITSKCCLSAFDNFQKLHEIYSKKKRFESSNARVSQIISPILAVARLADAEEVKKMSHNSALDEASLSGTYETALNEYYSRVISPNRDMIESETPEGTLKRILRNIALEILGEETPDKINYLDNDNHQYDEAIEFSIEEGWFEVNAMHLKCFMIENLGFEKISNRLLTQWLRICIKDFVDIPIRRKSINIKNEELRKWQGGTEKPKVQHWKLNISDMANLGVTPGEFKAKKSAEPELY